jgi:malonyl-CoA O-methyltransferase
MEFNKRVKTYNQYAFIQAELNKWCEEWLEPDLTDVCALEFGAGTGLFSQLILKTGANLTATDLSPEMVDCGEKLCPDATWLELDAWEPKINPKYNPYKRIYSASLLQWAPYPILTLKNWKDCLPNGGRTLNGFFVHNSLSELEQIDPDLCMFEWYEAESWDKFFLGAGWKILRSESIEKVFYFPNSLALFRHLHGIGATLPNKLTPSELRKVIKTYDKLFACDKGVTSTWKFYRIECCT